MASVGAAQDVPPDSLPRPDSILTVAPVATDSVRKPDTLLFVPVVDTTAAKLITDSEDLEMHLSQPPTRALFKSMLVPGWGQIGNHKHVKAGVFIGLQTWFLTSALHYGGQAGNFLDQYNGTSDHDARNTYYSLYLDRRSERNKYLWFFGLTTFISMFDAYVDAHLSGSPTDVRNRKVTIGVAPDMTGGANIRLTVGFR